jgi:hypothetical protein
MVNKTKLNASKLAVLKKAEKREKRMARLARMRKNAEETNKKSKFEFRMGYNW